MSDDLITRLRDFHVSNPTLPSCKACGEGADEIETVQLLIATSGGLACPNNQCNNQGWTAEQDGRGEWYQEQCEWCYTVDDSVFMRKQHEHTWQADPDKVGWMVCTGCTRRRLPTANSIRRVV